MNETMKTLALKHASEKGLGTVNSYMSLPKRYQKAVKEAVRDLREVTSSTYYRSAVDIWYQPDSTDLIQSIILALLILLPGITFTFPLLLLGYTVFGGVLLVLSLVGAATLVAVTARDHNIYKKQPVLDALQGWEQYCFKEWVRAQYDVELDERSLSPDFISWLSDRESSSANVWYLKDTTGAVHEVKYVNYADGYRLQRVRKPLFPLFKKQSTSNGEPEQSLVETVQAKIELIQQHSVGDIELTHWVESIGAELSSATNLHSKLVTLGGTPEPDFQSFLHKVNQEADIHIQALKDSVAKELHILNSYMDARNPQDMLKLAPVQSSI